MSSRFDPEYYSLYRPHYPLTTFDGIRSYFAHHSTPIQVVDLGCGTGHSTRTFLQLGMNVEMTGIDIDPEMINQAKRTTESPVRWIVASAENTTLPDRSVDCLLIGSAFHWMNKHVAAKEFDRILKPGGLMRIFEYQFPKAIDHPLLNEWIRREFNLHWKAPDQKPRGSLKEMTASLREMPRFSYHAEGQPEMKMRLTHEEFLGHLLSQSRVLHYLDTLSLEEKASFRLDLEKKIRESINPNEVFDFKLSWIEFKTDL